MMYPVTTLTASVLGLWLFWLSVRVIRTRGTSKITLGDGGDETLNRRIRGQANLSEYGPIGLILLFLAESQGAWFWLVAITAAVFVAGRLIHGYAFSFTDKWVFGRVGGMIMTFTGIVVLAITNLVLLGISPA